MQVRERTASYGDPMQGSSKVKLQALGKQNLYRLADARFVDLVEAGLSAQSAEAVIKALTDVPNALLWKRLRIAPTTVDRKLKADALLSPDQAERVLGLQRLLDQVSNMVEGSGQVEDFDAGSWMGVWMRQPNPALGGRQPLDYLGTVTGQRVLSQLLAQMQSGAYA